MRYMAIVVLASLFGAMPVLAGNQNIEDVFNGPPGTYEVFPPAPTWTPPSDAVVLYDNGPVITNPAACAGGTNDSRLDAPLTIFGFGHQQLPSVNNRVADDFTVPQGQCWDIRQVTFLAYQTGSGTVSTINHVNFKIWNGRPGDGGSAVIYGDGTTNVLMSSLFSQIWRSQGTTPCATNRPLMADVCIANVQLNPGTYWIDWQTGGTLASGPWCPPITIAGQPITGNGRQFQGGTANIWVDLMGTQPVGQPPSNPQGVPFILEGTPCATSVEPSTWGAIKAIYE